MEQSVKETQEYCKAVWSLAYKIDSSFNTTVSIAAERGYETQQSYDSFSKG